MNLAQPPFREIAIVKRRVEFAWNVLQWLGVILLLIVWPLSALYHSGPASPQQQPSQQQLPSQK